MSLLEDRILVWRFNRGDPESLCRIYQQHRACLVRVAAALLNDRTLVEDVLHDVFVTFAQSAGRFALTGSLKGYLSICIANRARDFNRALRRHPAVDISDHDLPSPHAGPETETLRHQLVALAENAVAGLPEEQRAVIVLHLLAGLPFREIAASTNVSINTTMSRYRYGLERLRASIEGGNGHA